MTQERSRRPAGLAARLLAAFVLVVLSGSITAWLVATAVSPGLFHSHLAQAGTWRVGARAPKPWPMRSRRSGRPTGCP